MTKKVIILGAGITGLVTAWKLAKEGYEITLIEKESTVGGVAGTIDWDGFKFDYGAHHFFSRNKETVEFYKKILPDVLKEKKNKVRLLIFGKLTDYPIIGAQIFLTLRLPLMLSAGFSFLLARTRALLFGIPDTTRLDEWIIRRFGKILYNIYFGPYLERVQKKPVHLLSSDIGKKKIPVFSIRQYIKREFFRNNKFNQDDYATYSYHYCVNGYGEFSNFFFYELERMKNVTILLNESLQNVHINDNKVISISTDKNTFNGTDFDIISTLPLEQLFKTIDSTDSSLKETAKNLEYTRMRFFMVKVKRSSVMGLTWALFNDLKFPYYRVSEHIYDKFNMTPYGFSSLCFEIPLNIEDALWTSSDAELLQIILASFNTVFTLKEDEIIDTKSIFIDHANPRMAVGYHESLEKIFSFIDNTKYLYSIGRHGLFTYINLDGCTEMALQFSDGYIKFEGKKINRNLIKKFHNIIIN